MNLNEVLGTDTKVIDLVARHLDIHDLLRLSLVCKQYERFQVKAFKEKFSDKARVSEKKMKRLSLSFCHIHTLTSLNFSYNQLTSIPNEIGQLSSLEHLYLNNNQLTSIPNEIGQLRSLKGLDLDHNQLTSIPNEIGQLKSLKHLFLNYNQLTSIPNEIGHMRSLKYMYLRNNLRSSIPMEIWRLESLCFIVLDRKIFAFLSSELQDKARPFAVREFGANH
jgi:Leucine-rich repeat (LRR) protein